MTIDEAKRIINTEVKFLNFKFDLRCYDDPSFANLLIFINAPDTRDRSQMGNFIHSFTFVFLESFSKESLLKLVFEKLMCALRHEAAELFKANGIDVFNEHYDSSERDGRLKSAVAQGLMLREMFTNATAHPPSLR